jgi:pyruvate/2-oxoglutarate/acetoin dehydrogenase E1 component
MGEKLQNIMKSLKHLKELQSLVRKIDNLLSLFTIAGSAMNGCRPIVEYMTFNFV